MSPDLTEIFTLVKKIGNITETSLFKKLEGISVHHYNYYFNFKAREIRRKDISNICSVTLFLLKD